MYTVVGASTPIGWALYQHLSPMSCYGVISLLSPQLRGRLENVSKSDEVLFKRKEGQ